MANELSPPLFPNMPVVWRLSAKWAAKVIDCTPHGIETNCGAKCCKGSAYWPPKASTTGACENLGPQGCILGADKPVTCLLYPFRLLDGALVLHGRTLIPKSGYCAPCYKQGTQSIAEANRANFAILFGEAVADDIVRNTLAGRDTSIPVPPWVLASLLAEERWETSNATPPGRARMHETPPAAKLAEAYANEMVANIRASNPLKILQ